MYPLRFPLAELLGSMGVPLLIRVKVIHDDEANVYVATSSDVPGLVVEAKSLDELNKEVLDLIPELITLNRPKLHKPVEQAEVSIRQHFALAA
jgi:predicted RNase H-like HicB family nuclease